MEITGCYNIPPYEHSSTNDTLKVILGKRKRLKPSSQPQKIWPSALAYDEMNNEIMNPRNVDLKRGE